MKDFDQERKINYAGYGLFADEEFGRTLFGEKTQNFLTEKDGYELAVLNWSELPSEIHNEMPESYRIYAARRKEGAILTLRVWKLTRQQRELADQWNWGDKLYFLETTFVSREDPRAIEIDVINNHDIGEIVDGKNYEPYLNDKETVFNFARLAREEYEGLIVEGRPPSSGERK